MVESKHKDLPGHEEGETITVASGSGTATVHRGQYHVEASHAEQQEDAKADVSQPKAAPARAVDPVVQSLQDELLLLLSGLQGGSLDAGTLARVLQISTDPFIEQHLQLAGQLQADFTRGEITRQEALRLAAEALAGKTQGIDAPVLAEAIVAVAEKQSIQARTEEKLMAAIPEELNVSFADRIKQEKAAKEVDFTLAP